MKLKDVFIYPNMNKLKLEYSNGECAYVETGWRDHVQYLNELKLDNELFTIHDVLTGMSYQAGKQINKGEVK